MISLQTQPEGAADSAAPFPLVIPAYVRGCKLVSGNEWLLLGLLVQLSRRQQVCFATQQFLADQLRISRRTVGRILAELEEKRLVSRTGDGYAPACETDPIWRSASAPTTDCESDKVSPKEATKCRSEGDKLSPSEATKCPSAQDKMSLRKATKCRPEGDKMSHRSDYRFSKEESIITPPTPPCGAAPRAGDLSDSTSKPETRHPYPSCSSQPDGLEEKLLEICCLKPRVGLPGFPGRTLASTLEVLRALNATPAELDRFVAWWRDESLSYKRSFPSLPQIAQHFHESRVSRPPVKKPVAAAGAETPENGGYRDITPTVHIPELNPLPEFVLKKLARDKAGRSSQTIQDQPHV